MQNFAALFCERQPHLADFVDAHEASEQAELLRANGLPTLNERALASPAAEVLDVIAEHNMAAVLLRPWADATDVADFRGLGLWLAPW